MATNTPLKTSDFLADVCEELFGCFVIEQGFSAENAFICTCCGIAIDIKAWVHAPHYSDCIIPEVREYLKKHRPKCVPEPR
jgi:hypothetical protein